MQLNDRGWASPRESLWVVLRGVLFLLTHRLRSFTPALYSSPLLCKILLWKLVKYKPEILKFVLHFFSRVFLNFTRYKTHLKGLAQTFRQKFFKWKRVWVNCQDLLSVWRHLSDCRGVSLERKPSPIMCGIDHEIA